MVFTLMTLHLCCGYCFCKPWRKEAVFGVSGKLLTSHSREQIAEGNPFDWFDPFPLGIDLRVGLNRNDDCARRDLYISSLFNDLFQGCTDVPLPFRE